MKAEWNKTDTAPCPLPNRDNAAVLNAAESGSGASCANEHATSSTVGGAVKLTDLVGALLNHRDKKRPSR